MTGIAVYSFYKDGKLHHSETQEIDRKDFLSDIDECRGEFVTSGVYMLNGCIDIVFEYKAYSHFVKAIVNFKPSKPQ